MLRIEKKKVIVSLTFLVFTVVMIGSYYTQMMPELKSPMEKPEPGQENYGSIEVEDPNIMMPAATDSLLGEYLTGYYGAYPFLFYKEVHLKEADTNKIAEILYQLTGLSKETLDGFTQYQPGDIVQTVDENGNPCMAYHEPSLPEYEFNTKISYEEFEELMAQADDIIGGGSRYATDKLNHNFSMVPMTYEDAVTEYEEMVTKDNIGTCYTRLFCDYMGIFVAALAIFVVAFYWNMDRRAKTQALIYSRTIGTAKLVLTRIGALIICMLPAVILPYIHMIFRVNSIYSGITIQWGEAVLQMLLWIVPEVMFVTALSAMITELISPFISIFVQGIWWYVALEKNALVGDISKWSLLVRHNTLGEIAAWNHEWSLFLWNRMFYLGLSFVVISGLIVMYDLKRKGKLGIGNKGVKRNHKKESVACL